MRLRRIEVWLEDKQDTMCLSPITSGWRPQRLPAFIATAGRSSCSSRPSNSRCASGASSAPAKNAVQTQIWTALIAMVVLRSCNCAVAGPGVCPICGPLRQQLFVYRDLWSWINQPFRPPIDLDDPQMALPLKCSVLDSRIKKSQAISRRSQNIEQRFNVLDCRPQHPRCSAHPTRFTATAHERCNLCFQRSLLRPLEVFGQQCS